MSELQPQPENSSTLIRDYDYELPPELIAQTPIEPRDRSRLLVLDRVTGDIEHRIFADLPDYLNPGDLLVVNDSRVIPARLHGWRSTGGRVELLLLRSLGGGRWEALVRPGRRLVAGSDIVLADRAGERTRKIATIVERTPDGSAVVLLPPEVDRSLSDYGEMPLPPYIHEHLGDQERYQTVYAETEGSAAAPTAGLHFTPELIDRIRHSGVRIVSVTLHVGTGTFLPVKVDDVREHQMHAEWFHVPQATIDAVNETRANGGRVIAVGSTSCRTLESVDLADSSESGRSGWTDLFIKPGFAFHAVDGVVTNFHLPRSTLMLFVSAFAGRDRILAAYREAVRAGYRFFSFGDAMLIVERREIARSTP
ncbi:MAG TPA: tRNA preQ1(34) S-adenosylmethionine ribosyltransferase-isomerase QueA [Nitrolancea sp.]|jgi:S-adenosylmethionine:tRNA ribosyltransferase-isomerase|nr:tRNA preQ1(34) S-adenosylmethionine ribosyltransferase-isomerase QueA [Nitrolancea sp.]